MSSFAADRCFVSLFINGSLVLHDGSNRLKRYVEINIFSVRNSTLNAAGEICLCSYSAPILVELIVMLRASKLDTLKSTSIFKTFHCINTQHSFSQLSMQ